MSMSNICRNDACTSLYPVIQFDLMNSPRYIVEVRTFGVWRPYVTRGSGLVASFVYRAFADSLAERLKVDHNLETQVVTQ